MPLKGYPQWSSCEPFTASTFQALRAPTPCTPPFGGAGWGGRVVVGSTSPFSGSWCSLVWERRTTCWVTMRVPTYLSFGVRPLSARGGTSIGLQCGCEGMLRGGGRGCAGPAFGLAPFLLGGVGAAKGLLPCFLVPKGNQPNACTLTLWWLKFGPTEWRGGGGLVAQWVGRWGS